MTDVNEYINSKPDEIRVILEKVRNIIRKAAPGAEEGMAYGMPAYKLNGKPLVYFGAQKKHLGFYATPSGHEVFDEKLSDYKRGKGSVQFPFSDEIPYNLIKDMVEFRVEEES